MKTPLLVAFLAGAAIALAFGYWGSIIWPKVDRESVYACRTPTVTTTNVMPNSAPTVETHAGYTRCRRIR